MKNDDIINMYREINSYDWINKFENELKNKFNVKYAIACSSGTAAIHSALIALGIKANDEIIVPNLTVIMTIMPILYLGAKPIFVDCKKDCIDFDYDDLQRKITNKTKAVIPVYMWGVPYNLSKLKKIAKANNLKIIEDACQAQGSKYENKYLGTIGDIGCFSLKDGKIVSCGEGGYILTNKKTYFNNIKKTINHQISHNPKKSFAEIGYNYRLTNFQAYIALNNLLRMDEYIINRKNTCMDLYYNLKKHGSGIIAYEPIYDYNYFSPLIILNECSVEKLTELSQLGVLNSVGSFGLIPASKRLSIKHYLNEKYNISSLNFKNTENLLNKLLAIVINNDYNKEKDENCIKVIDKFFKGDNNE